MRKLAVAALCFALLGHAWSQHEFSFNGASWKALDAGSRLATYMATSMAMGAVVWKRA